MPDRNPSASNAATAVERLRLAADNAAHPKERHGVTCKPFYCESSADESAVESLWFKLMSSSK
jgi:hypothetical protein